MYRSSNPLGVPLHLAQHFVADLPQTIQRPLAADELDLRLDNFSIVAVSWNVSVCDDRLANVSAISSGVLVGQVWLVSTQKSFPWTSDKAFAVQASRSFSNSCFGGVMISNVGVEIKNAMK